MKEYFSHDYKARTDRKMTRLMMRHGMAGIGAFWCIVEMLYEEGGILPMEYDRIAFELRTDNDLIKSVIEDFELFIIDGDVFYSESVNVRLKMRTDKSDQARENVRKRWDRYGGNTDVKQSNEVGNTIKEKESKEKESKENNNARENFEKIKDRLINQSEQEKMNMIKAVGATYPKANIKFIDTMINLFMDFLLAGDDLYKQPGEYRPYFRNWLLKKVQVDRAAVDKIYRDSFPKREEVEEKWEGIREIDVKEYMKKIKTTPQGGGTR